MTDSLLQFFSYGHLSRSDLRETSKLFADLAHTLEGLLVDSEMKHICLGKLLEAKDAAVRSVAAGGTIQK